MDTTTAANIQTAAKWITYVYALTLHEYFHAQCAYWLGDDTAKNDGRLTLNPLVHLDPKGFACLFIFGVGWAKPVPLTSSNFRYPKLYEILCCFAGPLCHFVLALLALISIKYIYAPFFYGGQAWLSTTVLAFLVEGMQVNILLAILNILPIAPFDGSHIITTFMPEKMKLSYTYFSIFLVVLTFFFIPSALQNLLANGSNVMLSIIGKIALK